MTEPPVVAVWKENWLPASQTFVANQVSATRRWRPVLFGVRQVPDGLPVVPDFAPFDLSTGSRAAHRLRAANRYRGLYDAFLLESGARLVHAHFGPSAMSIQPVARRLNLPLIVTFHGFDVNVLPLTAGRAGARYRARLTRLFDSAAALVAVSRFVADRLEQLGAPTSKVHVLPVGVPVVPRVAPPMEPSGVSFVGRLIEAKGPLDLVRAVAGLPEGLRSTPVRMTGWGPAGDDTSVLARQLGVEVEMLGRRTPDEVVRDLAGARVFCAPSRRGLNGSQESFGLVYLEAAMQGLPVVAYRHGGVVEAVEDGTTGLLAEEGHVPGLSSRLRTLLEDPDLAHEMGEAGRDRVVREFDVDVCTRRLESLYDHVTG